MPIAITPKDSPHPEIPYDKALVYLNISPIVSGDQVEAAVNIRVVPYRIIDGQVDTLESAAYNESIAGAFAKAQTDPALAAAEAAIFPALQAFITARQV